MAETHLYKNIYYIILLVLDQAKLTCSLKKIRKGGMKLGRGMREISKDENVLYFNKDGGYVGLCIYKN